MKFSLKGRGGTVLRWTAVLPGALIVAIAANWIVVLASRMGRWTSPGSLAEQIAVQYGGGLSIGIAFVIAAWAIAPTAKRETAIAACGLVLVGVGANGLAAIVTKEYMAIVGTIFMAIGAIAASAKIFKGEMD